MKRASIMLTITGALIGVAISVLLRPEFLDLGQPPLDATFQAVFSPQNVAEAAYSSQFGVAALIDIISLAIAGFALSFVPAGVARTLLKYLTAVLDRVNVFSLWLSGVCLVAMVVIIAYVVFGRYVLHSTPSWGEALSVTFMGWFIFFGAAVGVYERTHLGFDVLIHIVSPAGRAVLRTISDIAVLAFGVGMVWYGTDLTIATWDAIRPTLGIPDGFRYVPLAIGGLLTCTFTLRHLLARFLGEEEADFDRSHASLSS